MTTGTEEAVGARFELEKMVVARNRTWDVIRRVSELIRPGMLESEANALCLDVLKQENMERIWHPVLIRFGENTLKTFKQRSAGDPRLADDDIFFIDLGVVWEGHEGDAGDSFVVGGDPEMHACVQATRTLFKEVEQHWRATRSGGKALYDFAATRADVLGWKLNLEIRGHRVSDFPHAVHKAGDLGDFEPQPQPGLWILEIQLAHPVRPFGAFYEDLLM